MTTELATNARDELTRLLDEMRAAAPPAQPPSPAAASAPPVAPPVAQPVPPPVQRWAPHTVRATTSADSIGMQLLLDEPGGPTSVLDVDARLLAVRRFPPPAMAPSRRTLEAPVDLRAQERSVLRRRLIWASGALWGTLAAGMSVAVALA
jgi:hypothetical protein